MHHCYKRKGSVLAWLMLMILSLMVMRVGSVVTTTTSSNTGCIENNLLVCGDCMAFSQAVVKDSITNTFNSTTYCNTCSNGKLISSKKIMSGGALMDLTYWKYNLTTLCTSQPLPAPSTSSSLGLILTIVPFAIALILGSYLGLMIFLDKRKQKRKSLGLPENTSEETEKPQPVEDKNIEKEVGTRAVEDSLHNLNASSSEGPGSFKLQNNLAARGGVGAASPEGRINLPGRKQPTIINSASPNRQQSYGSGPIKAPSSTSIQGPQNPLNVVNPASGSLQNPASPTRIAGQASAPLPQSQIGINPAIDPRIIAARNNHAQTLLAGMSGGLTQGNSNKTNRH